MEEILILNLTNKCNETCKYCYENMRKKYRNFKKNKNMKNKNLYEIASNKKIKSIIITGGEPLLFPDFKKIIEIFKEKKLTLLTNGILLPDNKDEWLKNVDIVISLDGNNKIMKNNRNTNFKNFYLICNHIKWYLENAKSVTIQTVITPYNINEKIYFPFEYYGEKLNYRFSVPSHIFSPEKFKISENYHIFIKKRIIEYVKQYNYHLNCHINLFRKDIFLQNLKNKVREMIIPEFCVYNNMFYIMETSYLSLQEVLKGINNKIMESMTILTEYLKDKKDDYVFDPYCRLEFELFNKIDNTVMSER